MKPPQQYKVGKLWWAQCVLYLKLLEACFLVLYLRSYLPIFHVCTDGCSIT